MSKISEFIGAPKDVEYMGKTIKVYPLKVKDLEKLQMDENASDEKKMEMAKKMIISSLRDEEVKLEDISEMSAGLFTKLMNEINALNGFEDDIGDIKKKLSR